MSEAVDGRCSECGSDDLWAWYTQPERQSIYAVVEDGKVIYDYTGTTHTGDESGEDTEFLCGSCHRLTKTIEELVGAPPAPPKVGPRLKITSGISGNDQEHSFGNATLQQVGDEYLLEFSIATYISVGSDVKTQEHLAAVISNVLDPIVAEDPRISFEVELGPAGDGELDATTNEEENGGLDE